MSDAEHPEQIGLHQQILDAIPSWIMLMDEQLVVHYGNEAVRRDLSGDAQVQLRDLCGNLIRCINAVDSKQGCGTTEHCAHCVVRGAVGQAAADTDVHRRKALMVLEYQGSRRPFNFLISSRRLQLGQEQRVLVTIENISLQVELQNLVAICSHCKKVRLDHEQWTRIEAYLHDNYELSFTHSFCPDCVRRYYPEDP